MSAAVAGSRCTAVFHTFTLVTCPPPPPWSPCDHLSSHPTAACHAFTLNPSSLNRGLKLSQQPVRRLRWT